MNKLNIKYKNQVKDDLPLLLHLYNIPPLASVIKSNPRIHSLVSDKEVVVIFLSITDLNT